jgi:hypothetical protein
MKTNQILKGSDNLQAHRVDSQDISGSNISVNQLPCEIIIMLIRVIDRLLDSRKEELS